MTITPPLPAVPVLAIGFDGSDIATMVVALIALASAYFTQRASSKANKTTEEVRGRSDIERDAFTRAEQYLDGTITRQDQELVEARAEISSLRAEVAALRAELQDTRDAHHQEIVEEQALTRACRAEIVALRDFLRQNKLTPPL